MVGSEGNSQGGLSIIQMQALTSNLEKLFDQMLEEIHEHMDQMGNQIVHTQVTPNNEQSNEGDKSQFEEEKDNEEEQPRRRSPNQNNQRRHRNRREDDLGGIKIKVLSFQGKSDHEAYLEWEMHVDKIFSCQSYPKGGHIASKCPNKKTMIMKDSGEVEMDEESDNDLMTFLEDDNEKLPHDGDLLVVRRNLNMQEKGKDEA
ncbi:hypothetical protein CR513_48034, partial [Mucuna pruriens]